MQGGRGVPRGEELKTFLEWLGRGVYYHGASPDNRESIRTQGLMVSNPAEGVR